MANAYIALVSPVASGGVAHFLDTSTNYTSGDLLELRNNGTMKFQVRYDGAIDQDLTITGDLTVSGTGPHVIGGATDGRFMVFIDGSFTSSGGGDRAAIIQSNADLTGAAGDTNSLAILKLGAGTVAGNSITTQSNSETIGTVATVMLGEPNITKGTDTITNAATLMIDGAPTEGTNNYALWVDAGTTRLDGDTIVGASSPLSVATSNLLVSGSAEAALWLEDTGYEGSGDGVFGLRWSDGALTFRTASRSGTGITGGGSHMTLTEGGLLGLGDTANANMTVGLTINQGASDDQAFCLKSSDVATGLTTALGQNVETDDFFVVTKGNATLGGVNLQAMSEDAAVSNPFFMQSYGGTADTAKTTAARGLFEFLAAEHDGANALANVTADGNVFAVRARVGAANVTRLLVDEDGDLYSVTAAQTFDDHDDLALLNKYDVVRRDSLREQYAEFATEYEDELVRLGILGAPVAEGGMTNVTQLQRLLVGAMRQVAEELADTKARLEAAELKLLGA